MTVVLLIVQPAAEAQRAARIPTIGFLSPAAGTAPPFEAFHDELRNLGYVEGKSIALEFRFADNRFERLPELATELVRLQVDVIVTDGGDAVTRAAADATKSIPIVMVTAGDPVASGLVAGLSRPGGNVTGFVLSYVDLAGKRLQLLKEMVPAVSRVAVLWDADTGEPQFRAATNAARALGVQLQSLPVRNVADLDAAFEAARRQRAGALLQLASRSLFDNRNAVMQRVLTHRLPGVFELGYAETGALASYGARTSDNFRQAAIYVDKILNGSHPGELPVQQPVKFDLVINLRTAKALGLTIPSPVLLQATRIIE